MTESQVVYQMASAGPAADRPTGTVKDRVRYILEKYPDARDEYKLLQFHYWMEFCGLEQVADPGAFRAWYLKATSAKTLLQRAQEVQNERPELAPSEKVEAKRQEQGRQNRATRKRRGWL